MSSPCAYRMLEKEVFGQGPEIQSRTLYGENILASFAKTDSEYLLLGMQ